MWKVFSHHRHHHYHRMYKDYGVQIVWAFVFVLLVQFRICFAFDPANETICRPCSCWLGNEPEYSKTKGRSVYWAGNFYEKISRIIEINLSDKFFVSRHEIHSHKIYRQKAIFHHKMIWLIQSLGVLAPEKRAPNELFISNNNENPSVSRVNIWIKLYPWFRFGFGCGALYSFVEQKRHCYLLLLFLDTEECQFDQK